MKYFLFCLIIGLSGCAPIKEIPTSFSLPTAPIVDSSKVKVLDTRSDQSKLYESQAIAHLKAELIKLTESSDKKIEVEVSRIGFSTEVVDLRIHRQLDGVVDLANGMAYGNFYTAEPTDITVPWSVDGYKVTFAFEGKVNGQHSSWIGKEFYDGKKQSDDITEAALGSIKQVAKLIFHQSNWQSDNTNRAAVSESHSKEKKSHTEQSVPGKVWRSKITNVPLLSKPDGNVVTKLSKGEEVVTTGDELGDYIKVIGAGSEGWVRKALLEK